MTLFTDPCRRPCASPGDPASGQRRTLWLCLLVLWVGLLTGCASLQPLGPGDRAPSYSIPAALDNELGRLAAQSVPAGSDSGFRPLPMSTFSMDARLALVAHAQKSLDLQYYLIQNDTTGRTLMRAVRDAALRGVRVRVLVDDLYTAGSDRFLLGLAAYPNVEVRLFNPFPAGRAFMFTRFAFSLLDFTRVNHRMHNKLFIADGAFAIAGGRNMADEYFFHSKDGNFIDFDLLLAGPAVPQLSATFDDYWNSQRVYPLQKIELSTRSPQALRDGFEALTAAEAQPARLPAGSKDSFGYAPLSRDLLQPPLRLLYGPVHVFADDPEKVTGRSESGTDPTTVSSQALQAFAKARAHLLLTSPYFVPSDIGMEGLREAARNHIEIEVVTNSMAATDEPLASAAYASHRKAMLQLGVKLYEISSRELKHTETLRQVLGSTTGRSHTKLAVIDHATVFMGSMNLDFRSARINTELGLLIDSPGFADGALQAVDSIRQSGSYALRLREPGDKIEWVTHDNGAEQVYTQEPEVDFATRLKVFLLFPFVSERLL